MQQFLKFIRENIPVSVLMHILICLSYLSKESFQQQMEECNFVDKISEFVEYYSQINTTGNAFRRLKRRVKISLHFTSLPAAPLRSTGMLAG